MDRGVVPEYRKLTIWKLFSYVSEILDHIWGLEGSLLGPICYQSTLFRDGAYDSDHGPPLHRIPAFGQYWILHCSPRYGLETVRAEQRFINLQYLIPVIDELLVPRTHLIYHLLLNSLRMKLESTHPVAELLFRD